MSDKSLCELVLETIDTISGRKNRPNLARIFRHLHKLYDISLSTCESLLQSLLKEGKVIRVIYKGNISYRNAMKWKKYSYYMKKTMGSELPGSLLTDAISELIVQEPDYLTMGVPCHILEQHLLSMQDNNINKEAIHKLLQRELKLESLLQLDNGNYFLGPKPVASSLFERSEIGLKYTPVKKMKFLKSTKSDTCLNLIEFQESNNCRRPEEDSAHMDGQEMRLSDSSEGVKCEISTPDGTITLDGNLEEPASPVEFVPSSDDHVDSSQSSPTKSETNGCDLSLNGIIENLANHKLSEQVKLSAIEIVSLNEPGSESVKVRDQDIEINVQTENSFELDSEHVNEDIHEVNVSIVDVHKIIGVESRHNNDEEKEKAQKIPKTPSKNSGRIKTLSPSKPATTVKKKHRSDNEDEEVKHVAPVLERVRRQKKTRYDESEYYFPSLKRKTRDSTENDKKEEKRKKKKKKKAEGVFAKRVSFPGNTSMCCECNCYVSKVKLDPMIFCTTCSNQGHQSCAFKTMVDKNWYCIDCRQDVETCKDCGKLPHEKDRGKLYQCSECTAQFHQACHLPPIPLPFSASWICSLCSAPPVKSESCEEKEELSAGSQPPASTESRLSSHGYFSDQPPDPTNWTSDDVYNYFKNYFDDEVAKVILDQDIDGYSLKLLERGDVLKLDFKLGICLKILLHIRRLQLRSNNFPDIWHE